MGYKKNAEIALAKLKRNHIVFSFNLELICPCEFFQEAEIAVAEVACAILASWKTHKCKLISKLNEINRMIICTTYLHIASLHLSIFHYPFYIRFCKSPSFSLFSVFNTLKLALSILKTNFVLFHSQKLQLYKSINLKKLMVWTSKKFPWSNT